MTIRYDFFKSESEDRIYTADRFANRFRNFFSDGIVLQSATSLTTELEVTADDATLVVSVDEGLIHIQGYMMEIYTAAAELTLTAGDVTYNRIDRIIARVDLNTSYRSCSLYVLAGTPAGSPVAPALTQDLAGSLIYEVSLAQILVPQAAALILDSNVTDERDSVYCGIAKVYLTDATYLTDTEVMTYAKKFGGI